MRMRTWQLLLVQIAGLAVAAGAQAQTQGNASSSDYGVDNQRTRATVVTMPRADDANPGDRSTDDDGNASQRPAAVDTPPRGMTKARVLARYGAPRTRRAPVGQPPIMRWDYPGYRLYFEYDHVLHAVRPQAPVPVAHVDELATGAR